MSRPMLEPECSTEIMTPETPSLSTAKTSQNCSLKNVIERKKQSLVVANESILYFHFYRVAVMIWENFVFQKPKRLLEQLEGGKVSCYYKCRLL